MPNKRIVAVMTLLAACGVPELEVGNQTHGVENEPIPEPKPPVPPPPGELGLYGVATINDRLRVAMAGTEIQLTSYESSSTLDDAAYHTRETLCAPEAGEVEACRRACTEQGLGLAELAYCLEGCDAIGCSYNVCVERRSPSFVRFGDTLKDLSTPRQSESPNCTATTCPACNPPARVPRLHDLHLPVPPARVDLRYDTAVCSLRWMRFGFSGIVDDPAMVVSSDSSGIQISLAGTAAFPAVNCSSAPNLILTPHVRITLAVSARHGRLVVTPTVSYTGFITAAPGPGVNVSTWVVQFFSAWIRDAINDQIRTALQGEAAAAIGERLDALVRGALRLSDEAWFTEAFTRAEGIKVRFLRNP